MIWTATLDGAGEAFGPLAGTRVCDAMRAGALTCPPDTSLRSAADLMARHRIHSLVVEDVRPGAAPRWGIVSARDLVRAAALGELDLPASRVAATEFLAVRPRDPLALAARLMTEHEVGHVVVVDPASGQPVGVLSTLDVIRTVARTPRD